jgi:hypothetical protein
MDGVVFINNNSGFVFWARATRVRALNIARSRQGRIETNVLVEMLHVKQVVFRVKSLCYLDGLGAI